MAIRRSSARLSGGSADGADVAGLPRNGPVKLVNGKRGAGREVEEVFGNAMGEPEKKKRKMQVGSTKWELADQASGTDVCSSMLLLGQRRPFSRSRNNVSCAANDLFLSAERNPAATFKPQPVALVNSSDTPPDDDVVDLPPPPPPSERKIARRRDSTKQFREKQQSPSAPPAKRPDAGTSKPLSKGTEERRMAADGLRVDLQAEASSSASARGAPPQVDFLNFSTSQRAKPAGPRPDSPARHISRPSMGPPTAFVRKTRKSMRGLSMGPDGVADGIVPVPDRETPMIRKNKELREAQQRRSSLGMRGQRASSSLGRGDISAPHPTVETSSFFKHITPSLPEPHRARHLLVWCAKRATDSAIKPIVDSSKSKGKGKSKDERTPEGDRLVKDVMEEFMSNLGRGIVDTNVFSQVDATPTALPLKSHPVNMSNREVEAKYTTEVKKCKEENHQWSSLINRANRRQHDTLSHLSKKLASGSAPEPSLNDAESWMRDALEVTDRLIAEGEADVSAVGEFAEVEYKVDTLLQTSHTALQYSLQAQRFLDGIFSSLASDLRSRDRAGLPSFHLQTDTDLPDTISLLAASRSQATDIGAPTSALKPDVIHMLRALATAEAKQQSGETVAAAANVAPMPAAPVGLSSAMTPRRPAAGMTPRRAGGLAPGTTPRKGALGISGATPAAE